MVNTYIDDSSDPKRERYIACGGLIAHEDVWDGFDLLWLSETHMLEQPFRSTECECQHGQFSGWSKADCTKLMAGLVSLLIKRDIPGFATVVSVADFRAVFPGAREYDPYRLCVLHTIITMADMVSKHGPTESLKFCFEDSDATNGKTHEIYSQLQNNRSWKD